MGLNIGGNTFTQASSILTINTGVQMRLHSTGPVVRPNQTGFIAWGDQTTTWVNFVQGTWNVMPFPNVGLNNGSVYSTSTNRFTAPVTGMYFFQVCCWILKDGANDGYYWHPQFAVNGDLAGRAVNTAYPNYRIRGYGWPGATYETTQITEVYSLTAGDYVEHQVYSTGSPTNRYHTPYQRFHGFLLG